MIHIDDIERIFNEYPETFDGLKEGVIEKFRDWYPSNMHVIDAFEKEAFYLLTRGRRERYSIYTIREKLRWDSLVSESGQDYKLNNNFFSVHCSDFNVFKFRHGRNVFHKKRTRNRRINRIKEIWDHLIK